MEPEGRFDRRVLADRVQALESRAEIEQLRSEYSRSLDEERWDDAVSLFGPPARYGGSHLCEGTEEIRAYFVAAPTRRTVAWHLMHPEILCIDSDIARGNCPFSVPMVIDGVPHVCGGAYEDELRRVEGRWRFTSRIAHIDYLAPLDRAWAP